MLKSYDTRYLLHVRIALLIVWVVLQLNSSQNNNSKKVMLTHTNSDPISRCHFAGMRTGWRWEEEEEKKKTTKNERILPSRRQGRLRWYLMPCPSHRQHKSRTHRTREWERPQKVIDVDREHTALETVDATVLQPEFVMTFCGTDHSKKNVMT